MAIGAVLSASLQYCALSTSLRRSAELRNRSIRYSQGCSARLPPIYKLAACKTLASNLCATRLQLTLQHKLLELLAAE